MQISKPGMTWAISVGLSLAAMSAQAVQNGPTPTMTSIQAAGPFALNSQTVSGGSSFGGATVYSPTTGGPYAVVVFCPGFTATQSSIQVMGQRLASFGFVVATIDTLSTSDLPPQRATEIAAALKTVSALNTGPAAGKIDATRQVVTGHSMGGGGTLIAAQNNSSLKAAVGLAPWTVSPNNNFSKDTVPTAILVGSADNIAPPAQFGTVFYKSIPTSTKKLEGIISGETHFFVQESPPNQPGSYVQIAWIKRFADGDTRFSQFLNGDSRFTTFSSDGPF